MAGVCRLPLPQLQMSKVAPIVPLQALASVVELAADKAARLLPCVVGTSTTKQSQQFDLAIWTWAICSN